MSEMSDKEFLEIQIKQLKEVIVALENESHGYDSISTEEVWEIISNHQTDAIYPRLQKMTQGFVDVDNLKNAVDRLENDLNDCCIRKDQLHDDPVNSINKSDNHGVVPHEEPSNTDDSSEETVENENEVDEEIEDSKPTKQKNLFDFEVEE